VNTLAICANAKDNSAAINAGEDTTAGMCAMECAIAFARDVERRVARAREDDDDVEGGSARDVVRFTWALYDDSLTHNECDCQTTTRARVPWCGSFARTRYST